MHRPLKAIVVEDNEILCRMFAENLKSDPHIETAEALTLKDALKAVTEEPQVVLLVDLGLPDANGVDAVPALREAAPGATLVVVTGDETLREPAMMAGAHAVIIKGSPESHGEALVKAVRTAVENHELELLNASASRRRENVESKLDVAKKLLPGALIWLGIAFGYYRSQANAAESMRREGEREAMAWWADRPPGSP